MKKKLTVTSNPVGAGTAIIGALLITICNRFYPKIRTLFSILDSENVFATQHNTYAERKAQTE